MHVWNSLHKNRFGEKLDFNGLWTARGIDKYKGTRSQVEKIIVRSFFWRFFLGGSWTTSWGEVVGGFNFNRLTIWNLQVVWPTIPWIFLIERSGATLDRATRAPDGFASADRARMRPLSELWGVVQNAPWSHRSHHTFVVYTLWRRLPMFGPPRIFTDDCSLQCLQSMEAWRPSGKGHQSGNRWAGGIKIEALDDTPALRPPKSRTQVGEWKDFPDFSPLKGEPPRNAMEIPNGGLGGLPHSLKLTLLPWNRPKLPKRNRSGQ